MESAGFSNYTQERLQEQWAHPSGSFIDVIVHKENVSAVVARLHAASEYDHNWTLSIEGDTKRFPEGECGAHNDDEGDGLFNELCGKGVTLAGLSLRSSSTLDLINSMILL